MHAQKEKFDEEQRLRDRLLKRKHERQSSTEVASASDVQNAESNKKSKQPSSVASAATATTASSSPSQQQQKPDKPIETEETNKVPPPSSAKKENSLPSPSSQHSRKDDERSGQSSKQQRSTGSNHSRNERRQGSSSGKVRRRERRRENRRRQRRYDPHPRYPPPPLHDYRHRGPPPPGRWERDFGRYPHGGPPHPPYDRRYHDDRRPYYDDRLPPPIRRDGRNRRGRSPSASSASSIGENSKQGDWSYGDSYSSKSHSRSNSLDRSGREENGKGERTSPRGRDGSRNSDIHHSRRHDHRSGSGRWSGGNGRGRDRYRRDDYSPSSRSSSSSSSLSSSSSSSDSEDNVDRNRKIGGSDENRRQNEAESAYSKDQRTVFVSQLVMRTTEKDIRRYFKKKIGLKVNDVILLRDRRSRAHKGCAYVQFARIEDVATAVGVSGQPPDFQRFPILVKASEAEKNYSIPASTSVVTASMMGTSTNFTPFIDKNGNQVEAQKVYVGGLDSSVTEEHLFAIFSQFGQLDKVSMQMDPATNSSRGYAFLSFRDPKDANLAIQTMVGQVLAGRPMKTGWANQASSIPGIAIVTSEEFPEDGSTRAQKAFQVLGQLVGGASEAAINAMALSITAEKALDAALGMGDAPVRQDDGAENHLQRTSVAPSASAVPTVAEARASMNAQKSAAATASVTAALATSTTNMFIGRADDPTRHILVHNMFDKDEETDPGWEKDIEEEFSEEASKFGKIEKVIVMHTEPGGKIFATFEGQQGAEACAKNLAGRWFDKRQLRVDFVNENDIPAASS